MCIATVERGEMISQVLGFGASVVTAFLAGLYPALTAARLNPLKALQYE